MSLILQRLQALTGHIATADAAETPINVMHVARELVSLTGELAALLKTLGVFDAPIEQAGQVVGEVAAIAGQVVNGMGGTPAAS